MAGDPYQLTVSEKAECRRVAAIADELYLSITESEVGKLATKNRINLDLDDLLKLANRIAERTYG